MRVMPRWPCAVAIVAGMCAFGGRQLMAAEVCQAGERLEEIRGQGRGREARKLSPDELDKLIDTHIALFRQLESCDFSDDDKDSLYADSFQLYRNLVETWWLKSDNPIMPPEWAKYYTWTERQLQQMKERNGWAASKLEGLNLGGEPTVFVNTDANFMNFMGGDGSIEALTDALMAEGQYVASKMPVKARLQYADSRGATIMRLFQDTVALSDVKSRELGAAFEGWAGAVNPQVKDIASPTRVLLEVNPTVRYSNPGQQASLVSLRWDVWQFDRGNLFAYFNIRGTEERHALHVTDSGWRVPGGTDIAEIQVDEYKYEEMVVLNNDLADAFSDVETDTSLLREVAAWIIAFAPIQSGDANTIDIGQYEEEWQAAETALGNSKGRAARVREQAELHQRSAKRRFEAAKANKDKMEQGQLQSSIMASDLALCIMNSTIFAGRSVTQCRLAPQVKESHRKCVFLDYKAKTNKGVEVGLPEYVSHAYNIALTSRWRELGSKHFSNCHLWVMLNPSFLELIDFDLMALDMLARMLKDVAATVVEDKDGASLGGTLFTLGEIIDRRARSLCFDRQRCGARVPDQDGCKEWRQLENAAIQLNEAAGILAARVNRSQGQHSERLQQRVRQLSHYHAICNGEMFPGTGFAGGVQIDMSAVTAELLMAALDGRTECHLEAEGGVTVRIYGDRNYPSVDVDGEAGDLDSQIQGQVNGGTLQCK